MSANVLLVFLSRKDSTASSSFPRILIRPSSEGGLVPPENGFPDVKSPVLGWTSPLRLELEVDGFCSDAVRDPEEMGSEEGY